MTDDLTAEVLAWIETVDEQTREAAALYLWDEGIVRPEHLARQVVNALVDDGWRPSGPALLSGVRSRDARIVELEQRSAEAEAVIAEARERLGQVEESQWVSHLKVSIGVLSRAVVYDTLRILSGYRAGVDHG